MVLDLAGARSLARRRPRPSGASTLAIERLLAAARWRTRRGRWRRAPWRRRARVIAEHRRGIRLLLSHAEAGPPVGGSLAGAGNGLKVDDDVVPKDFVLRHDVEVVAVAVLVGAAHDRAPLRVSVVRAQVGHHDDDALAGSAARAAAGAGRLAGRGQLVAFAAAGAAPRSPGRVEESLGAGGRIDSVADTRL